MLTPFMLSVAISAFFGLTGAISLVVCWHSARGIMAQARTAGIELAAMDRAARRACAPPRPHPAACAALPRPMLPRPAPLPAARA